MDPTNYYLVTFKVTLKRRSALLNKQLLLFDPTNYYLVTLKYHDKVLYPYIIILIDNI